MKNLFRASKVMPGRFLIQIHFQMCLGYICITLDLLVFRIRDSNGDVKITPFVYQFYPFTNYPHIPGVQRDLFWNGSELEGYNVWIVEMRCFVRSLQHDCVGGLGHYDAGAVGHV